MPGIGNRVVPSLLARDLGQTLSFYESTLGFRVTGLDRRESELYWAEVTRDGVVIQFFADPPKGCPSEPVLTGTLYLFPESVEELARELEGRVPFEWGPEVMEYGMREFAVRDPNGYILAFTEPA